MLVLPATLTMNEAGDALRMLAQAVQRDDGGQRLVIDASGLERFDSSALAVLLESARVAEAWGKRLELYRLPAHLAELARLYGIDELLPAASEEAAAIAAP